MTADPDRVEAARTPRGLDAVDRSLISLLQEDGRTSFTTLAKEVGLSPLSSGSKIHLVQRQERTVQVRLSGKSHFAEPDAPIA